jgi:hypothetical protein
MRPLSCPYCYRPIPDRVLWFQCAGRGSPAYPGCDPGPDEARYRVTRNSEPIRPSFPPPKARPLQTVRQMACPDCLGQTGIRVCPSCHTPLSANYGTADSPLIALVGATGTGKTVYLTVLAHELRSNLRRRFGADVRLTGDAQGGFRSSLDWLRNNVDRLFEEREIGPLTARAPAGRRDPLVFEWRQEHKRLGWRRRYRSSYLSFYDTAGEDLTSESATYDQAYIGAADALIVLLDPFMIRKARDLIRLPPIAVKSNELTIDVLGRVTEQLRVSHQVPAGARIPVPVAVAFAKIDAFFRTLGSDHPLRQAPEPGPAYDETMGRATHEQVRALLHQWEADDIDQHLQVNYETFRYFVVSALGAEPDYDSLIVDAGGVRPHRVDEPLVWLLSYFGVVPGTRSGARERW